MEKTHIKHDTELLFAGAAILGLVHVKDHIQQRLLSVPDRLFDGLLVIGVVLMLLGAVLIFATLVRRSSNVTRIVASLGFVAVVAALVWLALHAATRPDLLRSVEQSVPEEHAALAERLYVCT